MPQAKDPVLRHPKDPSALLDIIRDVQAAAGHVSDQDIGRIAAHLKLAEAEVRGAVTFYHFFSLTPRGRSAVYLNDSITSRMAGRTAVARAFEEEAGCRFGEVSADGAIGLFPTSCIGMNDQEPSAIVDGVVFTALTPDKARALVRGLRAGTPARDLVAARGDGANQSDLVRSMVVNNIRRRGAVLFGAHETGAALRRAVSMTPKQVIDEVKRSGLLGRGGAGFPTGLKWEFCRREKAAQRYVVCNGDEGEPGTFKDRVILTELPRLLFEGLAVAGYAVGASTGILYLRSEYAYLRDHLEEVLAGLRRDGLLGPKAAGSASFDFDIVIKSGAGAYVCGEESALLESAEGKRGEPRDRPPFPVSVGYRDMPTTVNNIETLATAARILEEGAAWFKAMGTVQSAGTKLLSVSGDCSRPGVYEVEYGLTLADLLEMAGGTGAQAVQVGGPSGACVAPAGFGRRICFSDLATGGSVIVFGPGRDLFEVVGNFLEFFIEESCGWCVPCRAGNVLLRKKFEKIARGLASAEDLREIEEWGRLIKSTSRCGLGQTSPNPVLTTLKSFPELYQARLRKGAAHGSEFDLAAAVRDGCAAAGREPECKESLHD
ncbi:MAG TPA: NAD(P)H-dependent oxidoreductase subunit E [Candidatus Aminicenantes bacterium]|nr:NAD(P)H-dependent oxidoreductase subunit E [Candidatus Aminicenantes bacterium]HRY64054.1 NAD(P)H-dependent oxidoreductase subunit E [Candidatus Aminicenantes bacterium]HRZ70967.1 NAD(P)H-dependent oxidoreductase subunit E [Candidatus Aminicenantes bacterium]